MPLYGKHLYGELYYTSTPTYSDYLTVLSNPNRKARLKVDLLYLTDNGFEVLEEITQYISNTSGSMATNLQNGQRRNISLSIIDPVGRFNISPKSLWMTTFFRVYKGFEFNDGSVYWILQGTFVLDNSSISSNFSERIITLNGLDLMALLDGTLRGTIGYIRDIPVDTSLKLAVEKVLEDADLNVPIKFDSVFNAAGSAAAIKLEVVGTSADVATANTVYGAKAHADDALEALTDELADIATTGNVNDLAQTGGDVLILNCVSATVNM